MSKKVNQISNKAVDLIKNNIEALGLTMLEFNDSFINYIERSTTVAQRNYLKESTSLWQKTVTSFNGLRETTESIIDTSGHIKAVEIDLPFNTETFKIVWQEWIEYLAEQHNIKLTSRAEKRQLYFLKLYSKDNEERARSIIWYSIHRLYRTFYNYTDNELKGTGKIKHIEDGEY